MDIMDYFKGLNVSITVSDAEGNVVYMNDKSIEVNGNALGGNLMKCHNADSRKIIEHLMNDAATNVYTVQKGPVKKLIYQTPWYRDDAKQEVGGLVELSIVLPDDIPHHVRF